MEQAILDSEVKFAIEATAEGFSMVDDDFVVYILKGRNIVKEYAKADLVYDGETFLLCVDTAEIGVGSFDVALKAYVPDAHFADGFRTEIERVQLLNVRKL